MERYNVTIKRSAARELEAIGRADRLRIIQRIESLAEDPRPAGCEKLSGEEKYRIRQGSWRIVYLIEDRIVRVVIVKVGHRRDVYR